MVSKVMNNRKYAVKTGWIFNLEAMQDKLWCILQDIREGSLDFPINVAGTMVCDEEGMRRLMDEASELEWIAKSRKVTSREYGRIKSLVEWRVTQRYFACLNAGMDEQKAGKCFSEI